MNICMISFHSCPFSLLGGNGTGGMSVYLRELSFALTQFPDVHIDIFTRIQKPELAGIKTITSQIRVVHLKGGPCSWVDRRNLLEYYPQFTLNLECFIQRHSREYDVISSHYWLSGLVGEYLKYRLGSPLVHTYHTLAFLKKRAYGGAESSQRWQAESRQAVAADAIISSSRQEKESLVQSYPIPERKVRVVYPGVNPELFSPSPDQRFFRQNGFSEGDRILLYVGRIEPLKGLMTVVKALAHLKEKKDPLFPRLKLVVIGGGKERELSQNEEVLRIKKFLYQKNLTDKVSFLGSKRQIQLKHYYTKADAVVVPSFYESFGFVPVEALACGTPVLASHIGEMQSIIKEGRNGLCFPPGQPEVLSRCIQSFFSPNTDVWDGKKIRNDVMKKFTWSQAAQNTYDLYREVLRKKPYLTTLFQPGENPQPV
ncbi:glycosyltransferase [bacterium]|nr:glycosyltransferase [bacterium]